MSLNSIYGYWWVGSWERVDTAAVTRSGQLGRRRGETVAVMHSRYFGRGSWIGLGKDHTIR